MSKTISYLYPNVLEACHDELRRKFEPMIRATDSLIEVQILSGITLRLIKLSKASTLLCQAGLSEASQIQFRAATESIVNLLYIMYVGPSRESKTQGRLAKQFSAYGDVAYYKLLNTRDDKGREVFKRRSSVSDLQFEAFLSEKEKLSEEAKQLGCTSRRWHPMNLDNMAKLVRDSGISFVDDDLAEKIFSNFVSSNSATHCDALSLRTQYKFLGNSPLEFTTHEESIYADMVGLEAIWAWKSIADYYNQMDFLKKIIDSSMRDFLK